MMTSIEKNIGRPTWVAASSVCLNTSGGVRRRFSSSSARSQWRMTFSVMTMPASTSTPMEMAMPVSDMMCDGMPNRSMRMNEIRMEAGSGSVTIRMLRKWNRNRMCASVTRMISSVSACFRVSMARPMRSLRS